MDITDREEALRKRYPKLPEPQISRRDTALLIIDMQYEDAHPDWGICARFKSRGEEAALQEYIDRLALIIPNIKQLLTAFREQRMEVVYTRIQSLTKDGRDRSLEHKNVDIHCPPGSKEAQILEELAPRADEIVLSKTCSSVFNGTMIDYVLRNIGIQNLVVVGVVTHGCVEISVRDAADRSYRLTIVEDGCAAWTDELHTSAISRMDDIYGKVKSTHEILQILKQL
jgi:nicotinamidase-related amidase